MYFPSPLRIGVAAPTTGSARLCPFGLLVGVGAYARACVCASAFPVCVHARLRRRLRPCLRLRLRAFQPLRVRAHHRPCLRAR
eukprot:1334864-Alexandrium_andersonii.AAC.1